MNGILSGLRVVEGSAFVAAPLGGMTLAQLGADVIRFDQIGGGLDYQRWPLAADSRFKARHVASPKMPSGPSSVFPPVSM